MVPADAGRKKGVPVSSASGTVLLFQRVPVSAVRQMYGNFDRCNSFRSDYTVGVGGKCFLIRRDDLPDDLGRNGSVFHEIPFHKPAQIGNRPGCRLRTGSTADLSYAIFVQSVAGIVVG